MKMASSSTIWDGGVAGAVLAPLSEPHTPLSRLRTPRRCQEPAATRAAMVSNAFTIAAASVRNRRGRSSRHVP